MLTSHYDVNIGSLDADCRWRETLGKLKPLDCTFFAVNAVNPFLTPAGGVDSNSVSHIRITFPASRSTDFTTAKKSHLIAYSGKNCVFNWIILLHVDIKLLNPTCFKVKVKILFSFLFLLVTINK